MDFLCIGSESTLSYFKEDQSKENKSRTCRDVDPLATGVMIICTGKATKRIEEFQYHTKEYIATIRLGAQHLLMIWKKK